MTWYFTVNGVPACAAKETLDQRISPPSTCAHTTEEDARKTVESVRKWYPNAKFEVIEGHCPQPDAYDKYAEQVVESVKEMARESTQRHIGKHGDAELAVDNVRTAVQQILESLLPFDDQDDCCFMDFDLSYDRETEVITFLPKNLYTGLGLLGRYVPWWEVRDKTEYVDENGTKFKFEDGAMYVSPAKPLKFLKLTVALQKEAEKDAEDD